MDTENIIDNNDNVNENVVEEQYMYNMDTENIIDNNDNVNENVVEEQYQGRIQDFKLGGAHLKKLRRAEGGAKMFWVFSVKTHDFTPKKSYFSNFRGRAPLDPPLKTYYIIKLIQSKLTYLFFWHSSCNEYLL